MFAYITHANCFNNFVLMIDFSDI